MIDVILKGHDYQHDLFELIRVFYPEREIRFIDHISPLEKSDYVIESILTNNINGIYSLTKVYYQGAIIKEHKEDINNIHKDLQGHKNRIKTGIKKGIYNVLIDLTDMKVPWGILTGIRPVKIAHWLMDNSLLANEILNILKDEYKLSGDKAKLIYDIAFEQRKHIYPLNKDKYSLYIGIPFCPTRCNYCSFPAFKIKDNEHLINKYIDTLMYEIEQTRDFLSHKQLNTVYIGGGTPTSIKISDLEKIIKSIKSNFKGPIKEFTVEAGRPDTINKDILRMLKAYDIQRISINPQSMNNKTLKAIGRNHDKDYTIFAYNLAKNMDFDIINMDIILGLPGEGLEEVKNTLNEIKKLDPENLTVHTLALKRGSKLYNMGYNPISRAMTEVEDMLIETSKFANSMNLSAYYLYRQKQILGNLENIGYSKQGMECVYNISMMEERETIIGLGLGSVSKIYFPNNNRIERIPNFKDLKEYINRIDELINRKRDLILI